MAERTPKDQFDSKTFEVTPLDASKIEPFKGALQVPITQADEMLLKDCLFRAGGVPRTSLDNRGSTTFSKHETLCAGRSFTLVQGMAAYPYTIRKVYR